MTAAILILGALAFLSHYYWEQALEAEGTPAQRRFLIWTGKGLLLPIVFWFVVNCGALPGLPGFLPEVAIARSRGGSWLSLLWNSSGPPVFAVSSFWTAVTFGWLLVQLAFQATDRGELARQCGFFSLFLVPVASLIVHAAGLGGLGFALLVWLVPIVHFTLPLAHKKKIPPSYARAIARIKFGKYKDAELEVLHELEKCVEDFDGWLMLAELYARHFHDLPEADRTIRELCSQPNVTGIQISLALHRLADWHLDLGADPLSARSAFAEICQRWPGTHFARMAQLRINQQPASREHLLEQRKPKTFRLPALRDDLDAAPAAQTAEMSPSEVKALADKCVEKLRRNPNDVAARERFAILLAEQLGKVDLAIEQLELLLAMPDPPEQKAAEWLALVAAWRMKYQQNWDAARLALKRLIQLYPQTPQAFAAQRRLSLVEVEQRLRKGRPQD